VGERRGAVRRCHRRVDVARDVFGPSLVEAGLHQIQRSDDAGQQVVEVVGDAAGQLSHRFHLLRLQQRFLGGLQPFGRGLVRGDVAGYRIIVLVVGHPGPPQPAIRAILVKQAALEPDGGFALAQLFELLARRAAIVGMFQPFRSAVEQFGLAPAERPGPGRIDRPPDAVAIEHQHQILRHVPDSVALPGLFLDTLGQRRIQFDELVGDQFLVMHIGIGADPANDPAVLVAGGHGAREKPAEHAIGTTQAEFDFIELAAGKRRGPCGKHAGRIIGMDDLAPLLAVELAGAGTRILMDTGIEPIQRTIRCRGPDMVRQRFGERAKLRLALPQRLFRR